MEVICLIGNKMKSIKYHNVGTFPKSNKNNLRNRGIIDTPTHIHDRSLSRHFNKQWRG
jgi:hypothetical protein